MEVAKICRSRRIKLLIAGDAGLAARLGAGLHLPDCPSLTHWRGFLTVAAHDRRGLVRAGRLNADAAVLSPVFATLSHPAVKPLGLLALRRLVRQSQVPVVALGGVSAGRVAALTQSGVLGLASVSAF